MGAYICSLELSLAANLGKTLLETNEALKLRHDALLSRLPVMQSQASTNTSAIRAVAKPKLTKSDAWSTDDDVPASALQSRAGSVASSACGSPIHSRTNSISNSVTQRSHHVRRISASPSALLALSETNAELISELTHLRASTDSAQIEGARRLRKLEREIGGLKAELDATQRTNAELEERVKEQLDEERKRDREERLKKLRLGEDALDQESDHEIRDFAPQGQGVDAWDSVATPRMPRKAPPPPINTDITPDLEREEPHSAYDASVSSATSSRSASYFGTISPGEYAVVAQLYRKVEELQEANAELGARNRVVHERLARAERDALEIKRVYDEIGEEIGADADMELSDTGDGGIRGLVGGTVTPSASLRSRRTARSITPKASSWRYGSKTGSALVDSSLEETPTKKSRTGTRGLGNKHMYKDTRILKSRKPLTDTLFAPPSTQDDAEPTPSIILVPYRSPRSRTRTKDKAKAMPRPMLSRSPSPYGALGIHRDCSQASRASSSAGLEARSASSSSYLSTSSYASLARYAGRRCPRRSLGSELGDEFGADWGLGRPEVSRRSTLFDDESLRAESIVHKDSDAEGGEDEDEADEDEDPALAALRNALSPPNAGRLLEVDEHILPIGALRSSPGEAFQIVSHAVAVRPNRWLEADDRRIRGPGPRGILMHHTFFAPHGPNAEDPWETTRYPDIEPGKDEERGAEHLRTCRRARALERMASTRRASMGDGDALALVHVSQGPSVDPKQGQLARSVLEMIKRTSTDALIELWIFLQFVVVIGMFLYTTTRRGPREVIGAPPRRA